MVKAVKNWVRTGLLLDHARGWSRREDLQFLLHCIALLALMVVVRPMFTQRIPHSIYASPSVFVELISQDVDILLAAAKSGRLAVPRFLYLVVPTAFVLLSKRKVTWDGWEHGHVIRAIVMGFVIVMAWSTATFDYNSYLMRLHEMDRLVVVGLAMLSWRTPVAVPIATACMTVMIYEADVGCDVRHDDFDWRPLAEVLVVFSCFVWASVRRSFKAKHFLFLALLCWGSYYFQAGVAKVRYAATALSWIQECVISNFMIGAYVRGWVSFIPEDTFLSIVAFVRRTDVVTMAFTVVVELGSIVCLSLHPRLARAWLLGCVAFNGGVAILAGVVFWKWIAVSLVMWWVLRSTEGQLLHKQIFRHWAVLVFGVAVIYYSDTRTYFFPQTGVFWWSSKFQEVYPVYAIGESGTRYRVDVSDITPMQVRMLFEEWAYLNPHPNVTGVYGNTGHYRMMKDFEAAHTEEDARALVKRYGRVRLNNKVASTFDHLISTWFDNVNRHGKRHQWLGWIGRIDHVQVYKQWMDLEHPLYKQQEPIRTVEVWNEKIFYNGVKLINLGAKKVRTITVGAPSPGDRRR